MIDMSKPPPPIVNEIVGNNNEQRPRQHHRSTKNGGGGGGVPAKRKDKAPYRNVNQQVVPNGYESDTSSSYSAQNFHADVPAAASILIEKAGVDPSTGAACMQKTKCNYGLLQNMKLWNTRNGNNLRGDIDRAHVMSPTNHHHHHHHQAAITNSAVLSEQSKCPPMMPLSPPSSSPPLSSWSSLFTRSDSSEYGNVGGGGEALGQDNNNTPADKYLANAQQHLSDSDKKQSNKEEFYGAAGDLCHQQFYNDSLSQQMMSTYLSIQQTDETYRKKLNIWRTLYLYLKVVYHLCA